MDAKRIGLSGENAAVKYLIHNGYTIIARNVRLPAGELDIVALDREVLCFIEVKCQMNINSYGRRLFTPRGEFRPDRRIDYRKRKRLCTLGAQYLDKHTKNRGKPLRFDIIGVYLDMRRKRAKIDHSKNVAL